MDTNTIYLDTYVLQKDMRIRLPKAIVENMKATKGESLFDIFLDKNNDCIILKLHQDNPNTPEKEK